MRYVIVAPFYRHCSAGHRALYELQKHLVRAGQDSMVLNYPASLEDDDIVIYPEIVWGNPFNAKRVVRYILAPPAMLGGPASFDPSEMRVAYNSICAPHADGHILMVPVIEDFFVDRGEPRTVDCVYGGRGLITNHPVTESATKIDRRFIGQEWPKNRHDMANLLNETRTLYTYDDMTTLADEARLCGCDVKLIRGDEVLEYPHPVPDFSRFPAQLREFIERTQGRK